MCPITSITVLLSGVHTMARNAVPEAAAVAITDSVVTTGPSREVLWMLNDTFLGGLVVMAGVWVMIAVFFAWNLADLESPCAIACRLKARVTLGAVIAAATANASRADRSRRQNHFISKAVERQQLLRPDPCSTPEPELKIFMPPFQEMCEMERGVVKGKVKGRRKVKGKGSVEVEMVELVPSVVISRA